MNFLSETLKFQDLKLGLPQASSSGVWPPERDFTEWKHQEESWSFQR